MAVLRLLLRALAAVVGAGLGARADPMQYLFVSQPAAAKVVYFKLPHTSKSFLDRPTDFITENLQEPTGLAVDPKTNKLFVCDSGQRKILAFTIAYTEGKIIVDGTPETAASSVDARWVAIDGVGDIFFTDSKANTIQRVYAERFAMGEIQPEPVYQGSIVPQVSSPAGLAVDNFHVYWANKAIGMQVGSLLMGLETPPDYNPEGSVRELASNTLKAYGVCLGTTNAFYTGSEKYVYGIKKEGGPVTTITDKLLLPRGCVWDGDGTIYVADKGGNAVYFFPGQMHDLHPVQIHKAFNVEEPFGVATMMFSRAGGPRPRALLPLLVILAGFWMQGRA